MAHPRGAARAQCARSKQHPEHCLIEMACINLYKFLQKTMEDWYDRRESSASSISLSRTMRLDQFKTGVLNVCL
eukprot:298344-Pelagomonas_calceolata.AAC.12